MERSEKNSGMRRFQGQCVMEPLLLKKGKYSQLEGTGAWMETSE